MITGRIMKNLSGLKKYGLTKEQYFEMLERCGNKCMICGRPPTTKALCIDHNHRGSYVRGILCNYPCNKYLIGKMGDKDDSVELFLKAAEYLKQARDNPNKIICPPRRKRRKKKFRRKRRK